MLYTLNGSYPAPIPFRIRLSNGMTRTEPDTFTTEEIADAGYVEVPEPPVPTYPEKLDWNGTDWFIRQPYLAEVEYKWQEIRNECLARLYATDYKVIKAMELGVPLEQRYIDYRQELRDLYNNVNNVDPWFVEYPVLAESYES